MPAFDDYRRQRTVLLTTRKRDGTTVGTPVNIALGSDGRAYFRTWSATGKAKRIRNFPQVWGVAGPISKAHQEFIRRWGP
jgi:uncharacterized protein